MSAMAKRLYGPAKPGTTAATLFTAPTEGTATIRHIRVANTTAASATITLSIGVDASGTRIYDTFSIPAHGIHDTGYAMGIVLGNSEILQGFQGTAAALVLTISGSIEN